MAIQSWAVLIRTGGLGLAAASIPRTVQLGAGEVDLHEMTPGRRLQHARQAPRQAASLPVYQWQAQAVAH